MSCWLFSFPRDITQFIVEDWLTISDVQVLDDIFMTGNDDQVAASLLKITWKPFIARVLGNSFICSSTIECPSFNRNLKLLQLRNGCIGLGREDGVVDIYDAMQEKLFLSLQCSPEKEKIESIFQLSNGKLIISTKNCIKLWDLERNICEIAQETFETALFFAELPGDKIAIGFQSMIHVRPADLTSFVFGVSPKVMWISCLLSYSNQLVTAGGTGVIKILNGNSGAVEDQSMSHVAYVECAIMISSSILLTGACDYLIKSWDLTTRKCLATYRGHSKTINFLLHLPATQFNHYEYDRFISASTDKNMKIWSLQTNECLFTLVDEAPSSLLVSGFTSLRVLPDGRVLSSGVADKNIKMWSIQQQGPYLRSLVGHQQMVCSVVQSVTCGKLISLSIDGHLKFWTEDK